MSNILPFSFENTAVRALLRDGEPWFVLADVCRVLEIGNPSDAARRLDEDEKMTLDNTEGHSGQRGGAQSFTIINESGLYSLILTSRKPAAKRFKKWVTAEVLPAIRKTGAYAVPAAASPPPSAKTEQIRIVRFKQLRERVPYTRMHIDRLEKAGKFPRRVRIGTRAVGWVESEVDGWLRARAGQRGSLLQHDSPPPLPSPARRKRTKPEPPAAPVPEPAPSMEITALPPTDRSGPLPLAGDILDGPEQIAAFIGLTVPSALRLAADLPVFWIGERLFARKSTLLMWFNHAEAGAVDNLMTRIYEEERNAEPIGNEDDTRSL